MFRNVASLALLVVSSAAFAQVTGVSRSATVDFQRFIAQGSAIYVDESGQEGSTTTLPANVLTYDVSSAASGAGFSGVVRTAADESDTILSTGGGLTIVGTNTAMSNVSGMDCFRIAQAISTATFGFTLATATMISLTGTDTQNRFGNEVRLDAVGGPNYFRSFFGSPSASTFSFSAMLPAGQYRLSSVAAGTVSVDGTVGSVADGQIQTFQLDVAPVPEPASLVALSLGACGLLRRRRSSPPPQGA